MKHIIQPCLLISVFLLSVILVLPGCAGDSFNIETTPLTPEKTVYTTPSPSLPGLNPAEEMLSYYEKYAEVYGITVEEARQRLSVVDSFRWVQTELWYHEADTFAGLWHEGGDPIVVRFTRDGEQTLKKYVPQEMMHHFEVLSAVWTLDELLIEQDAMTRVLRNLGINSASNSDVKKNRVEVYVLPEYRALCEEAIRIGALAIPECVDIYLLNPPGDPLLAVLAVNSFTQATPVCATPTPASPLPVLDPEENPLMRLLPFVSDAEKADMRFYDIPALSAYQKLAIPPLETHPYYKKKWSQAIERFISTMALNDNWGIDSTGIQGILAVQSNPSLLIIGGRIDTAGLRQKLEQYKYIEQDYAGYPVFSATMRQTGPETSSEFVMSLAPAVGIIEKATSGKDEFSVILMVNSTLDKDVSSARAIIEAAIKNFQAKTSPGDLDGTVLEMARSLGRTGSLFFTTTGGYGGFENRMRETSPENVEKLKHAIGGGKLSRYRSLAVAYRGYNFNTEIEFVLAYDNPAAALANAEPLRERLTGGRLYSRDIPLNQVWSIKEVQADGPLLKATVKLNGFATFNNLEDLLQQPWFLCTD